MRATLIALLLAPVLTGCATACVTDWPLAAVQVAASAATGDVAGAAMHGAVFSAEAGRSAACQRRVAQP